MNIIDNLNILNTNLDNAKFKIAKNLKDKGVQALPSDKLDMLADKIVDIPSGSCNLQELSVTENGVYTPQAGDVKGYSKITVNVPTSGDKYDWKQLGFESEPVSLKANYDWAVNLQKNWSAEKYPDGNAINAEISKINNMGMVEMKPYLYFPLVDLSHITDMSRAFQNSIVQNYADGLDTSKATNFEGLFGMSMIVNAPNFNYNKADSMSMLFGGCFCLETINFDGLVLKSECDISNMFMGGCPNLTTIYMRNCPQDTIDRIKAQLQTDSVAQAVTIITE